MSEPFSSPEDSQLSSAWTQMELLFAQASALPELERQAFIVRACGPNAVLREEVLRLLAAQAEAADFLAPPTLNFSGHAFGSYEAIEEIGRGGMSVVYKGRRRDGDFEKLVAIKILLLHPDQNLQTSETQILAGLEHPNIARLLDSGSTASGFRFLVMEYVDGVPCPQYAANLNLDQKLRLFLSICRAVQFSHQSLVVHRDLKPANILVTADGTAKLLDFGIAKLLRSDAALNQTHGIRAYTPDYASPEQILGGAVTTASDVYSLGALLCELVSGRPPRQLNTLSTAELVAEVQRDALPQLPFAGDLSAIAQKALRRLPSERYPSASELANDVERFLNQEPVSAQVPTWAYRTGKFIRRHRLAVATSALAILALVGTTTWAVLESRLATERFDQVRRLASKLMFEIHDVVDPLPGSLAASKLITDSSMEYLDAISSDPRANLDVQLDVVRGYLRLAAIAGKDLSDRTMGDSAKAESLSNRAVQVSRRAVSQSPASAAARALLADSLNSLGSAKALRNQPEASVPLFDEAIQLATTNSINTAQKAKLAYMLKSAAAPRFALKQTGPGLEMLSRSQALNREIYDAEPTSKQALKRLSEIHQELAFRHISVRDFAKGSPHARESYRLHAIRYRNEPAQTRLAYSASVGQLAAVALHDKNLPEAIRLYREMVDLRREVVAAEPEDISAKVRLAAAIDRLGNTLSNAQQHPEAIRQLEEALQLLRKFHAADKANSNTHRELLYTMGDISEAYGRSGNSAKACAFAREFLADIKTAGPTTISLLKRHSDRATDRMKGCR